MHIARPRRALLAAFLALALPLTLAACGDDGDGGETDTQAQETETEGTTEETPETTPTEDTAEGELIHVEGSEFKFEGLPESLAAGSYTFHFMNVGKEQHELLMFELLTDTPLEELIKLPEKKAMEQIRQVGATFAKPGEVSETPIEADLQPGRYAAVCFVSNKKGPHAFQGMTHELTVE